MTTDTDALTPAKCQCLFDPKGLTVTLPCDLHSSWRDSAVARERDRYVQLCKSARPAGGRAWSSEQSACFEALTHVADAIANTQAAT